MITIGFAQFCPVRRDVAHNIATLARLLDGVHADLLVLPELANSGYLYASPEELAPYAEPRDGSGPFLSALARLAGQMGGVIVAGFAERAEAGLYNAAAAVSARGVLQLYRKTHLFGIEKDLFLPGDTGFRLFIHQGARVGMMICYDWFFPEAARTLALAGAQVIAHPADLMLPYCQAAMVTRCLENHVYAITANRFGTEELNGTTLTFTGASQILDITGRVLQAAPASGECVALCEIEPALADNKWITPQNNLFTDRRPEMYDISGHLWNR
jgi:predicted amidohydrolase